MNTNIAVLIAVVVIIGGGIYFFSSGNSTTTEDAAITQQGDAKKEGDMMEENDDSFEESGSGTFMDLMALGKNIQCDFLQRDNDLGGEIKGKVYMADRGERLRGDFTMMQDGEAFESHIIRDGRKGYTWGETPFGTVATEFDLKEEEDGSVSSDGERDPFESDDTVDYDCKTWRVQSSMFVPPSDIEFQNITAEIMQIEEATGDLQDMKCAACDQVPDPQGKAQCKAALGCS